MAVSDNALLPDSKDDAAPHSKLSRYAAEFIGTFFLVFTIGCNVHNGSIAASLSIGFMLMAMIYALGSVSGGHFNPAVTFAVLLAGRHKISNVDAIMYMLFQLAGGAVGAVMYRVILGQAFVLRPVGLYTTSDVWGAEVLWSAALCYVVLNVATTAGEKGNVALRPRDQYDREARPETFFAFAIGATVTAASIAVGPISGCCLNPAVTVSSMFVAYSLHGWQALHFWWPYALSPMAGAMVAFIFFYLVRRRYEYPVSGEQAPAPPVPAPPAPAMREMPAPKEEVAVARRKVEKKVVRQVRRPQAPHILQKHDPVFLGSLGDIANNDLFAGLYWSFHPSARSANPADLDLSAVKYDVKGNDLGAIYFASNNDVRNKIEHSGDKTGGDGESMEKISFKLSNIQKEVHAIFFCATIFSLTSLKEVKQWSIRIVDEELKDDNREILRYEKQDVPTTGEYNALVIAMMFRRGDDWCFKAIDDWHQIKPHGTYRDLNPIFKRIWRQTTEVMQEP